MCFVRDRNLVRRGLLIENSLQLTIHEKGGATDEPSVEPLGLPPLYMFVGIRTLRRRRRSYLITSPTCMSPIFGNRRIPVLVSSTRLALLALSLQCV